MTIDSTPQDDYLADHRSTEYRLSVQRFAAMKWTPEQNLAALRVAVTQL